MFHLFSGLQKLNPDAVLPRQRITVIARSDKSGTTEAFTTALAKFRLCHRVPPGPKFVV